MSPESQGRERYDADEVREKIDLLALIGQYVALKKRGGRHIGLCPFHQEKTPSFSVDPQKGFWHCFGCGKGGDAFTFVMQFEHLTFGEAVERLAQRAGVRPHLVAGGMAPRKEERDFLFEANAAAAEAFRKALAGKAGAAARAYLVGRGITAPQAERFGLGYAPAGWDALMGHLQQRHFNPEIMEKAGLALKRSNGSGYIDRFRNRVMVPIHDRHGRVVGFGGRALSKEDQPKYLNTGETPIFHKGRTLYALHLAVPQITGRGRVIITEGYFDTIACHLAGFTEAVATLGTALSEDHVKILRPLVGQGQVILVYDADSAGLNAALRSQAIFRAAEVDVRIALLPAGHDPDTLIREQGASAFEACLTAALSPVAFELERLVQQQPAHDAEGRIRLFRAAAKVLQPLSALERAEYALRLIERLPGGQGGTVTELQQALLSEIAAVERGGRRSGNGPAPASPSTPPAAMADVPLEREVIRAMVQHAGFAREAVFLLPAEAFTHARYRAVFEAFLRLVDQEQAPDARHLVLADEEIAATVSALAVAEPYLGFEHSMEESLKRLSEQFELRVAGPKELSLEDRDAVAFFTAVQKGRSDRLKEEHGEQAVKAAAKAPEPLPDRIARRTPKRQG